METYDQVDIIDKMFENIIEILYNQLGNVSTNIRAYNSFQTVVLPSI
jgi:hypothetical protein